MAKRVLVVDDDQNTVKFLTVALQENGYEAIGAYDGEEGLQKLQEAKPDLIVLDVMMPKRTGFTLFKRLKKDDDYKDIPVIMLTGIGAVVNEFEEKKDPDDGVYDPLKNTVKKAIQQMREDGLVRPEMFVDKPIDPEALVAKVRELIGS
jgi:DNA-binding response OmpR family regulator